MKSIIFFIAYSFFLQFNAPTHELLVKIEVMNEETIEFPFSIKYQEIRSQIHVKSESAIRSMRLVDNSKKKTAYNTIGSNFVVIPLNDFTPNESHILEIKFIDSDLVVLAKIDVSHIE